jgi:hypothetical protein
MLALRQDLVTALVACADTPSRAKARRFVNGLSADELEFIAEFLGACILESERGGRCSRAELAARIAEFQQEHRRSRCAADRDHKMILLLEYLCRTGAQQVPTPARAGRVN